MKKTVILTVVVILVAGGRANADLLWESGHHVFSEGYEKIVTMNNDASADITGGRIGALMMNNLAKADVTGGTISEFVMSDSTKANVSGGWIGIMACEDTSISNIYTGSTIELLRPDISGVTNVYGGDIDQIFALGSSVANIYDASLSKLDAVNLSEVNLHVKNYHYNPTGGSYSGGLLTGNWLGSGNNFSIELFEGTIDHINFVPEPCSFILLTLSSFILYKRKNNVR